MNEIENIPNKITIGFVGTFGKWHGIEVLEQIIPVLIGMESTIHFLLVGDGEGRKQLQHSLQESTSLQKITFTGKILPHYIPVYLAQCDIVLSPTQLNKDGSRFFGSPTKLFEYLSMGKLVIASHLEQLAEIVSPFLYINDLRRENCFVITDQVGILVDPLDVAGFIEACLYAVRMSASEREKMGRNARKKALDQYTWRHHVKKIIDHACL